ncbi:MAG TPA: alpha/beta hydrolase [Bryobacteraceae bacterium]|nr:alpha/beta hydrolase [Bryobacteraceae bacterium]
MLALAPFAFALDYQINANIHYDKYTETVLDVLQSSAPALGDRPGVIVIHGSHADKEMMFDPYCLPFVRHGLVVANVEYRAASADDVLDAAKWFREHAAQNKVDPKRIIVVGAYEGGQLARMAGMMLGAANIAGVIDFYGTSDMVNAKGQPPVLALNGSDLWPQIFQWLKKHKISN